MFPLLFLLAAPPPPPPAESAARRVIDRQCRVPPRPDEAAGLSADEAAAIHQLYLRSIGQRLDMARDERR